MALPKQVRQQIEEAARIGEELAAAAKAPEPAPPAADPAPPQEPPAAPTEPAAAAPVPAPAPDAQYQELLQQYRSLQGIHRSLTRSNGELQSQVQTLQAQVRQVTEELERVRNAAPKPPTFNPLTPEEVKDFGPDLISVIERKAQEVAAPLKAELEAARAQLQKFSTRNEELERSLNGMASTAQNAAFEGFKARLVQLVPDVNVLNHDQNFLSWLSQVDPLDTHGRTLQERLDEAVNALNAEAAAGFFSAFKKLAAARPQPTDPKANLAAQAQPESRGGPDAPARSQGKVWTRTEIEAFYTDVSRGKYTPQEKQRIEREIYQAQRDNRIAA